MMKKVLSFVSGMITMLLLMGLPAKTLAAVLMWRVSGASKL